MWLHRLILTILFIIIGSSCTVFEDTTYLKPIPQETIFAYKFGSDIENKLQAVIAARQKLLSSPHFYCANTPEVISVEKLNFEEAYNRVKTPGVYTYIDEPKATVWLVIFECDIQIDFSPLAEERNSPATPEQHPGCMYTIMGETNHVGEIIGTIKCP